MRNVLVCIALLGVLAHLSAAFGPISFSANFDLTAPNMKNGGGFKGTTKYSWPFAAWSVKLDKYSYSTLQTYSSGATSCTDKCQQKKFCTYNLDLNIGDTFNIADWIVYANDVNTPVDFNSCNLQFYYQDPTNPADWHLLDYNAKPPTSVTVTSADAQDGTGNHGDGGYRIYMKDDCGTDDHMTVRVSPSRIESDVAGFGSGDVGCASRPGQYAYEFGSCGCQKAKLDNTMPQFFYDATFGMYGPTDRTDTINGVACKHYPNIAGAKNVVSDLWVSAADDNTPCRVQFTDGRVYTFTNVNLNPGFSASDFAAPSSCSCSKLIDTVMVLDRSNSVTVEQFNAQKTFATQVSNQFTISGSTSQIAVGSFNSGFSSVSRIYSGTGINSVTASIRSAACCQSANVTAPCCNTTANISSAIIGGANQLVGTGSRPAAAKNLVIVSNGFNQTTAEIQAAIDAARARVPGINIFIVSNDQVVLSNVVTAAGGVEQNVIPTTWPQFGTDTVNMLSSRMCQTAIKPCGDCCGLCDCETCLAPDFCDSDGCQTSATNGLCCAKKDPFCAVPNKCTTWTCVDDTCATAPVQCQPDNACFSYSCVDGVCKPTALPPPAPANKCERYKCDTRGFTWNKITTPCTGADPCLNYACDPVLGCQATKKDPLPTECIPIAQCICTPTDQCFDGACVNNTCVFTPKSCNDNDACTIDTCVNGTCAHTPVNCDDGNPCTLDSCVNGACVYTENPCDDGNLCTKDTCAPTTGCRSTPITCDDSSMCTNDMCDPATGQCVFPAITCSDGIPCTNDTCHPFKGCVFENIDCPSSGQCKLDFCQNNDDNLTYTCVSRDVSGCTPDAVITAAAAGTVGAAAIAGIIVAIVVCVGAASGASYAMYQRMNVGDARPVNNNPIYRDDGNRGANPLYRSSNIN